MNFLSGLLPDNLPVEALVAGLLAFGSVALLLFALSGLVGRGRRSVRDRLASGRGDGTRDDDAVAALSGRTDSVSERLAPIGSRLAPSSEEELSTIRRRLVHAGYMSPAAVWYYYIARAGFAAGLPLGYLTFAGITGNALDMQTGVLPAAILLVLGIYIPNVYLDRRISKLRQEYRDGFPDALDLLVVCVEAGLGLDSAIARVAHEMGAAHPRLGEQFRLLSLEMRAGSDRDDALRNMADRMGLDEAQSLVTLLIQSQELGTSIADALRVYANEMRYKRIMRAEAKAYALPVKLSLPLVLNVFPVLMVAILLPAGIQIFINLVQ